MGDHATEVDGVRGAGAEAEAAGGSPDLALELERARERIAFYESFDRLIQENIARSGDLLREAAEQRAAAAREVAAARAELDRRLGEQRSTLTAVAEDLLALQEQAGALARRVAVALAELGATPGAATPAPAASASEGEPGAAVATAEAPPAGAGDGPIEPASDAIAGQAGGEPASEAVAEAAAAEGRPLDGATSTTAEEAGAASEPERPRVVSVVVHGVPRAADALSLQRHLDGLGHVEAVEAREYVAGVLRLQVVAREPLALDDLRRWEGGARLEPVHVLADVIEVKLPGAAGF